MKPEMKSTIGILLGALVVFGALIFFWSKGSNTTADPTRLIRNDSYSIGPTDAKVTLVEFADFECPSCAAEHPIIDQYLKEYAGKVRFVYRYFPLPQHTHAYLAINFAEAAGAQNKFFEMGGAMFEHQDEWGQKPADPTDLFVKYAKALGLDTAKMLPDIKSMKYNDKASRDLADGEALGVNSTPTLFLNGKKQVGILSLATLRELTDQALSGK